METKGSILVIDDELGIREGCRRVLTPEGFDVQTAASIKEGQKIVQEGDFDLVLLDIMMPDGRGIDLIEPIHEKDPDIVCVVITGYATVELAVNAIKQGAYNFISKPFTSDILIMTVNQGLEKRQLSLEAKRLQKIEQHAAELAHAKEEMERLDKFKSAFMLMVAHELRSPVAGAQSLVRTLLRGLAGDLNEQQDEILSRINVRLDMLIELINDLLSLAASKTADQDQPLERITLGPLIQKVGDHFAIEAQSKNIGLTGVIPQNVLTVQASEDGIEKILHNLIGNAIKYTPEGGSVSVELFTQSDQAAISVSDTGIGIPENDLSQIGEEFFRAGNARGTKIQGTGLGLSIVKQYIDRFGGKMDVKSKQGEGTTFTILLPLVDLSA